MTQPTYTIKITEQDRLDLIMACDVGIQENIGMEHHGDNIEHDNEINARLYAESDRLTDLMKRLRSLAT